MIEPPQWTIKPSLRQRKPTLRNISHSKCASFPALSFLNVHRLQARPPYTSLNVISGNDYTEHDDRESFFYVLILFFLSSKGPMERCRIL